MRTFTFSDASSGFVANVTVTDNGDGTLSFVVEVDESTGTTGDMRAIYFNNAENSYLSGLSIAVDESDGDAGTTSDTTDVFLDQDIDRMKWVGSRDTNVNGEVIKENDGAFDTGIEFGSQGMSADDVQRMEFTLSADQDLTIDSFDWTTIGLRVTSVGDVDGSRNGSLKLAGEETTPPDEPSTVVAENDFGIGDGAEVQNGGISPAEGPGGLLDWRTNDFDPEGDTFQLTTLSGAGGTSSSTADALGWFDWVDGDMGGEIRLNALTGIVEVRDIDGDFAGLSDTAVQTSISYEITDSTGATDTATVTVELEFFFD